MFPWARVCGSAVRSGVRLRRACRTTCTTCGNSCSGCRTCSLYVMCVCVRASVFTKYRGHNSAILRPRTWNQRASCRFWTASLNVSLPAESKDRGILTEVCKAARCLPTSLDHWSVSVFNINIKIVYSFLCWDLKFAIGHSFYIFFSYLFLIVCFFFNVNLQFESCTCGLEDENMKLKKKAESLEVSIEVGKQKLRNRLSVWFQSIRRTILRKILTKTFVNPLSRFLEWIHSIVLKYL